MGLLDGLFNNRRVVETTGEIPNHVAIIMDGNGRWAKSRGLPRTMGHKEGSANVKRIVRACDEIGIRYLTVYAFSTENWKRPKEEVDILMELLLTYLRNAEEELGGEKVRILVIGDRSSLPEEINLEIQRVTKATADNEGITLIIALNYGSRDEILQGIRRIAHQVADGTVKPEEICESTVESNLFTAGIPDPDLLIRTSGEQRISNFLLWQLAYTELWFTDAYWPDFNRNHLLEAINAYGKRHRRFGGV